MTSEKLAAAREGAAKTMLDMMYESIRADALRQVATLRARARLKADGKG